MSSLTHLEKINAHFETAMIDIRDRVTRERQFGHDALQLHLNAIDMIVDHYHKGLQMMNDLRIQLGNAHEERDRMLSMILASDQDTPPVIDGRAAISRRKGSSDEAQEPTNGE